MKKLIIAVCFACLVLCACDSGDDVQNTETGTTVLTEESTTEDTTATETEFELNKDEILWGKESSDYLFLFPAGGVDFERMSAGEITKYGDLEDIMANAGDKRIAVLMICDWDENDMPENTDPFANLPEGYRDAYSDADWNESRSSGWSVYFMTSEEIDALVCDPKMKVMISSVSYEAFLDLGNNADLTY